MPILNSGQIREMLDQGTLILNARRAADDSWDVEPASYDLRVGTVLWKDPGTSRIQKEIFKEGYDASTQAVVTLKSGQMVFVITHEELQLPVTICATVYSRNKLQKENILALNAGHIDPGYQGPIIIRLINLGAMEWPLAVGQAVFTVVFHTVEPGKDVEPHGRRTMEETLEVAQKAALQAFSNPFHDLYSDEIERQLLEHYSKVEHDIRVSLSKEFFRRDEISLMLIKAVAAVLAGLAAIAVALRLPWGAIFKFLWSLLGG